ncbi:unnamed protein product [marine sediment metagenome]|uniref:Uncharacterized protein n=1 Tax=marine sediment metagenome TaxID=412755 RepID=X1GIG9_9ZZZZ
MEIYREKIKYFSNYNYGNADKLCYYKGEWILLDGSNGYTDNYDPTNPHIIRDDKNGRDIMIFDGFVLGKGLDSWDLGFFGQESYVSMCDIFINNMNNGLIDEYLHNSETYIMKK